MLSSLSGIIVRWSLLKYFYLNWNSCADIVLKDKIFVYDLEGQRLGWTNYDCKSEVK